jgi:ricin-type beta-trefoil lectin protein/glycosyl hydrolase family 43
MRKAWFLVVLLGLLTALLWPTSASAAPVTVTNGTQFTDTGGNIVHAHGGGVLKVGSYYYWFGENRNANGTFRYVSAYRSTDLRTWEFRNHVLTQSSSAELNVANIERPKVIYNPSTGQFVMWMHKENGSDYSEARAAVATSSTVDGNYTYRGSFRPLGHMSRDITAYVDDNGAGYMVSAARENLDLHIYRLTSDFTGVASLVKNFSGNHREAPALFKRNGVYFLLTSGATGWSPNQQQYATASELDGTWSAWTNVGNSTTYGSQTTYVLPVQGSQGTSYLYLGDRWAGATGGPVNDSRYVWLPLRFQTSTSMSMGWFPQVSIDTATGEVNGVGSGGYLNLVARHSGKCADVSGGSYANGAGILQATCGSGSGQQSQQWWLESAGSGYYRIVTRHSGLCLDVSSNSTADGANLLQWPCGTGTNQQWQLQDAGGGYYRVVARHSGKCLDVAGSATSDGTRLTQWTCNGGTNQQFERRTVS